jgi:uncharacterized protein involved in outer membrane biogenesis
MLRLLYRAFALTVKATFLVAVVAGIVAYAKIRWDLRGLKTTLVEQIAAATGRTLTINGDVGIDLFALPPRITIDDVRVGNAPWGSRPDMIRAKRLEAELDLLPLLVGDVAVPRLRLIGVDILLETNKAGDGNWEDIANFETAAGPVAPGLPILSPVLGAGTVSVAGGTVTLKDGITGTTKTINLGGGQIELASAQGGGAKASPCN